MIDHDRRDPRRHDRRSGRPIARVLGALAVSLAAASIGAPARAQEPIEVIRAAAERPTPVLDDTVAALVARVSPSVVSIAVEAELESSDLPLPLQWLFPDMPEGRIVSGGASGFVIDPEGAIMTSAHVVDRARRLRVRLSDGRELPATVVGTDDDTDLAVIRVAARGLVPLRFAEMASQRVGEPIVAVGAPYGLDATVSAGVLSAVGRGPFGLNEIEDYVQTDASVHPGSSGGPLLNRRGEVVGVTTVIVGSTSGLSFGVSADLARDVARQLLANGRVHRPWIGAGVQDLTDQLDEALHLPARSRGALVNDVDPRSPAARAGIAPGDAILSLDGAAIEGSVDFTRRLLRRAVGEPVELVVVRGGRERRVSITTAEQELSRGAEERGDPERPRRAAGETDPGIEVVALTSEIATQIEYEGSTGAVVSDVRAGSSGDRAGLRPGDVIVEMEHRPVRRPEDVRRALADGSALARVQRQDRAFYTVIGGE